MMHNQHKNASKEIIEKKGAMYLMLFSLKTLLGKNSPDLIDHKTISFNSGMGTFVQNVPDD